MERFRRNTSLKPYNTFGINASAKLWLQLDSEEQIFEFLIDNNGLPQPYMVLGGGSNVLFTGDFPGLILKNEIKGKEVVRETDQEVWLRIGAGENWHETVLYCVEQGWGGIENLSLIPGCVGAAPIQNIGAYGVEIKDVFDCLEAIHLTTAAPRIFSHSDCEFGYRDSVFKRDLRGKYIITRVTLKLSKNPVLNTSYGSIRDELEKRTSTPGIKEVSQVVCDIRSSKLPDPKKIGNAGSFFKNPVVSSSTFDALQVQYPEMPHYPQPDGRVKIPAAWLIQTCGWKGKSFGEFGCTTGRRWSWLISEVQKGRISSTCPKKSCNL